MNTSSTAQTRTSGTSRPEDRSVDAAEAAVFLSGVDVDLAGTPVLRGLNLELGRGETIGLAGPNGSGKTTLLRVIATLLRPVGGVGRVLGAELGSTNIMSVRPSIALVGHTPALYPRLTLAENLRFIARLTGRPEPDTERVLDAVGLAAARNRKAVHCSLGMLRRAEIARVLLVKPRLLLLDEAHAGLDEAAMGLVEALVSSVSRRGGTSVLVSHDRARLAPAVDRIVNLLDGRATPDRSCSQ